MASFPESGLDEAGAGRALAEVNDVDPHPFGAEAKAETAPRPLMARLLDYSAHAAIIVGLVGFAWTVSSHVVNHPASVQAQKQIADASAVEPAPGTPAAAASTTTAAQNTITQNTSTATQDAAERDAANKDRQIADLRRSNKDLGDELHKLRASVAALQTAMKDDKRNNDVRTLQAGLDAVQNGLATARNDLNSKIDRIEREPSGKLQKLDERVGRLEKGGLDQTQTASIGARVPVPPTKPIATKTAAIDDTHKAIDDGKATVLPGYVVRDVYDGVAVVEGRRGPIEVVPGVSLPGAGVVKSIDRHGNGWTVTTTKGVLAYAAPTRDTRRNLGMQRPYYPDYREDF